MATDGNRGIRAKSLRTGISSMRPKGPLMQKGAAFNSLFSTETTSARGGLLLALRQSTTKPQTCDMSAIPSPLLDTHTGPTGAKRVGSKA